MTLVAGIDSSTQTWTRTAAMYRRAHGWIEAHVPELAGYPKPDAQ